MSRAPAIATPMRRALSDPNLLGLALEGDSWAAWRTLLIAMRGEALTEDERAIFARLTNRQSEPLSRVEEFWGIIGRRGGKSRAMAVLIVFLACLVDYRHLLTTGERPIVLCLGQNARQAAVVYNYVAGIMEATPLLAELIRSRGAETLSLTNGIDIEIRPASFRGLRGVTAVAVVADEIAFWYTEDGGSVNPDSEILSALRPSLATTGGPLIAISTPYARRGVAFEAWRDHYGEKGDKQILVAQGASRDFNPSLPQRVVDRALARDPAAASAEWLGLFRTDVEGFVGREAVEACVEIGCFERAPLSGVGYTAFCDPSGGSADAFSLAIAHRERDGCAVLDCVRERMPAFSPEDVVDEFSTLLKQYRCASVSGDRYAGEFPRELFQKRGVTYRPSERSKSELYVELLPLINSRRVELLDDRKAIAQLVGLERRTARSGKDSIDHAPGGHDDRINAIAGALVLAQKPRGLVITEADLRVAASLGHDRRMFSGFPGF